MWSFWTLFLVFVVWIGSAMYAAAKDSPSTYQEWQKRYFWFVNAGSRAHEGAEDRPQYAAFEQTYRGFQRFREPFVIVRISLTLVFVVCTFG